MNQNEPTKKVRIYYFQGSSNRVLKECEQNDRRGKRWAKGVRAEAKGSGGRAHPRAREWGGARRMQVIRRRKLASGAK